MNSHEKALFQWLACAVLALTISAGCDGVTDIEPTTPLLATSLPCPSLPSSARPIPTAAPTTLLETGLYCDVSSSAVASDVQAFRPKYELWSDGAVKTRWVYLPPGTTIDASDPNHWSFPVGTRFWKELQYQGRRVETRLIIRTGAGPDDFLFAAYQWNSDGTDATLVPAGGAPNVAPISAAADAPMHDIPSTDDCATCHAKLPERILGFSAIQLNHQLGGLTLAGLAQQNRLTPAPAAPAFEMTGDATAQAALGYLHANCSHCHNDTPSGVTYPRYMLRLRVEDTAVEATEAYRTAVNVLHTWLVAPEGVGPYRIQGGDAEDSELYFRTGVRVAGQQMPPIATKIVDDRGHALLAQWIDNLSPQN